VLQLLAGIVVAASASAQTAGTSGGIAASDYPNKPIRVVVPSPPGGPPDLLMRVIAPRLSTTLGQPVIVENRLGAGGLVGTTYVAKLPADGYTWLFTTASHVNITHVSLVAQNFGQVLVVPASSKATTFKELIDEAVRSPGKLTYAHAGLGTASHIPAEIMKTMTGTDILPVPYKGVAEATNDVIAGRVDLFFVGTQIAQQHVQAGTLRALAITGARRWKGMPQVPTLNELGLTGFNVVNWFGLWMPAGVPARIVDRVQTDVVRAIQDPDVVAQFDALGLEGVGMQPADFAAFVARESAAARDVAGRLSPGAGK
jgi:tripartite-type tricarboxylate transporter receptor subunit TctC